MTQMALSDRNGDIDLRCSRPSPDSVELHVDADASVGVLRVRMRSAEDEVVMERLVRSVPSSIRFRKPERGSYAIEVEPLRGRGASRTKNLTWSDWGEMMGDKGGRGGDIGSMERSLRGEATLRVA